MNKIQLITLALLANLTAHAQTIRYQNSVRGGFTIAANSLILKSGPVYVNNDGATNASSYSDLILPANSTIAKAFLYVEGYVTDATKRLTSVKFKVPGGSYITLNTTSSQFVANPMSGDYTQLIFDVSNLMPLNGFVSTLTPGGSASTTGRYYVSDPAPFDNSTSNYGYGWALYVVYTNTASKYRNVTIADRCGSLVLGSPINVNITNIAVPSSGTVNAVVAVTGCWGEDGLTYTDNVKLGRTGGTLTALPDPTTGATNNALNGTIGLGSQNNVSADGGPLMSGNYTGRNPYNTFGTGTAGSFYYDADIFNASGTLPSSATPINVTFQQEATASDALGTGAYGISIDVASAIVTKSISPASISTGGTATYTFLVTNTVAGAINLTGIGFTDNLPSGLIVASPNGASIVGGSGGTVTAVSGSASVSLSGLNLNIGQSATIKVNVTNVPGQLNTDCSSNPAAFTNGFSNIANNTANLANGVTPQCLIVTDVMPIELAMFTCKRGISFVELTWTTASEKNSSYFEIERSKDGLVYKKISDGIKATGNSTVNTTYSYRDALPDQGISYYRLKQVDIDGKYEYSRVVSVSMSLQEIDIQDIVWNGDLLNATVNVSDEKAVRATLIDINGRGLVSTERYTMPGRQEISINTNGMTPGIYFLLIESEDKINKQLKVIKF